MQLYDTVIVGGGAAGLTASVLLGRHQASVLLLEKQPRVGKKLLATGNGTCNITNAAATPDRYHGGRGLAEAVMRLFSPLDTVAFFNSIGVTCVKRPDGKYYPRAEQAAAVLDQLRAEAAAFGVTEQCETAVLSVKPQEEVFCVTTDKGDVFAKTVLVCTGGAAAPQLGGSVDGYGLLTALGHTKTPLFPSIVQLRTDVTFIKAMKGLRIDGTVTVKTDKAARSDTGEILFTEYGLSGPAVMQVSRIAGDWERQKKGSCTVTLDLFPDMREADLTAALSRRRALKGRTLENFFTGFLNKRIGQTAVRAAGLSLTDPVDSLTDADIATLASLLKGWEFSVLGTKGFTGAQVTSGGITANEFDQNTMESCYCKGVFAAGEVLDVDGDCGGFNLQFAFASAAVATSGILKRLKGCAAK